MIRAILRRIRALFSRKPPLTREQTEALFLDHISEHMRLFGGTGSDLKEHVRLHMEMVERRDPK